MFLLFIIADKGRAKGKYINRGVGAVRDSKINSWGERSLISFVSVRRVVHSVFHATAAFSSFSPPLASVGPFPRTFASAL